MFLAVKVIMMELDIIEEKTKCKASLIYLIILVKRRLKNKKLRLESSFNLSHIRIERESKPGRPSLVMFYKHHCGVSVCV